MFKLIRLQKHELLTNPIFLEMWNKWFMRPETQTAINLYLATGNTNKLLLLVANFKLKAIKDILHLNDCHIEFEGDEYIIKETVEISNTLF
jgi:hypothetical protein